MRAVAEFGPAAAGSVSVSERAVQPIEPARVDGPRIRVGISAPVVSVVCS